MIIQMQMFDELPEEELDRIERLVDAASAGPWISYVVGRDADAGYNRIEFGWCNELGSFHSVELIGGSVADQDFIASARQDVSRLLREVRTLRARLYSLIAAASNSQSRVNSGVVDASGLLRSAPM